MHTYPYLRAYMAGIVAPTVFLLIGLTVFVIARHVYRVDIPIERAIVFPMAVVPNLWGLWNMLYLALRSHRHLPIGLHGAMLPVLLVPAGVMLAQALDISFVTPKLAATMSPVGFIVYYLVWKHLVGFFNQVVGIE